MLRPNRLLAALVLALSVTGCSGLPGTGVTSAPAVTADDASVKVTIGTGFQTQAIENIALTLRLELPYAPDPAKRVQVISVQSGVPMEFKNLPTGYGTLTAIATDTTNKVVIDKQSQPIQLRPGYQAQASFTLVVGGSSALDMNVYFNTATRNLREDQQQDGLDDAFRGTNVPIGSFNFVWKNASNSVPVVFTNGSDGMRRRVGDGYDQYIGYMPWLQVPMHAVRVDSAPLGPYSQVRHYRWENIFMVDGMDQSLIVDRWISPMVGLLKEEITKPTPVGPVSYATLVREGL